MPAELNRLKSTDLPDGGLSFRWGRGLSGPVSKPWSL